jgi:hypothetical protein
MFLPPMPIPNKAKGLITVVFDIDSTGKVIDFEFTPTKDNGYNRKLKELFAGFQFRPGSMDWASRCARSTKCRSRPARPSLRNPKRFASALLGQCCVECALALPSARQ